MSVKSVQIAHIDHDHTNSDEANLVALCLQHHDAYDTTPRQTKRLTEAEVRSYRQSLYDLLEKKSRLVQASFLGPEGTRTTSTTNAYRLGQIVEAFDEDMARKEPNGVRLSALAIKFAIEEGDFAASRQAELELMRTIEASKTNAPWFCDHRELEDPIADPVSMLLRAVSQIGQFHWVHAAGVAYTVARRAFLGDKESFKGITIRDVPSPHVRTYAAYLRAVASNVPHPFPPRVRLFALQDLQTLACRVTATLAIQGIDVPETPGRRSTRDGWRVLASEEKVDEPEPRPYWLRDALIGIVHEIANLKTADFEAIIRGLPSGVEDRSGFFCVAASGEEALALDEAKSMAELWSTELGSVIVGGKKLQLKDASELAAVVSHVAECRKRVTSGLEKLKSCLIAERAICTPIPTQK